MQTYNPSKITVIFRGIQLSGFAKGTFVKAARSNETFKLHPGSDGTITRTRMMDQSGEVTFTLMQESDSNLLLSSLAKTDEISGLGVGALFIKDLLGTTVVRAGEACIKKPADVEFGDEAGNREWTILCKKLDMTVGGATDVVVSVD